MNDLNSASIEENLSPEDKKVSSRDAPDSPFRSILTKFESYLLEEYDCTVSVVRINGDFREISLKWIFLNFFLFSKTKKTKKGRAPFPRSSFIACKIKSDQIFIHGGNDDDNDFNDAHILDIGTKKKLRI